MAIKWVGNSAYMERNGVEHKVAYRAGDTVGLTMDAPLFGLSLLDLANTSASEVQSQEPKKRGRKAKVAEVPDPDLLDELEI